MYIMCVILCLFSALSRRVGALQISIIIIKVLETKFPLLETCGNPGLASRTWGVSKQIEKRKQTGSFSGYWYNYKTSFLKLQVLLK